MESAAPICQLDDTWEDVHDVYIELLKSEPSNWSCHTLAGVDKEVILSAPEIMDPKTDSGFGYADVYSLRYLLESGSIPAASTLTSEAAVLDVIDYIHMKELAYLQGYSLTQSYLNFPYFLCMDRLKAEHPTLFAYCRGVLRSLDCVLRAVFATTIRSEEEFMLVPPDLDRQTDCPVEEILAELEAAAAVERKAGSPAIAARLDWRRKFLATLSAFLESQQRCEVEAACDMARAALALLKSDVFQRTTEPQPDPRLLRSEVGFWVSIITPTQPLPPVRFADAMAAYAEALEQVSSLKSLLSMDSLAGVADFVMNLGSQKPLLPVRSLVIVVLFSRDPNESFLHGRPLHQRLLETLSVKYGAPLYQKIFERDMSMVDSVVKYNVHRTMDPLKVTPRHFQFLQNQTVDAVQRWTMDACKLYLVFLETMLCNRGLAHRRLMNMVPDLTCFQELSYSTDITIFAANVPGVSGELETECMKCCTVLTLFANNYILQAMELIMGFEVELDLLTQAELVPALWYVNFAQRAQMENLTALCLQNTSFIPQTRINKRTHVPLHNLCLTTRRPGQVDVARASLLDAAASLSDATYLSACLMEKRQLIDLQSGARHSLTTVENIFNHRLLLCFGMLRSPPLRSYEQCLNAKPALDDADRFPLYAKKAAEAAGGAAEKLKAVLTSSSIGEARRQSLQATVEGLEKTARVVAASLATLAAICDDEATLKEYRATVERPGWPSALAFSLHKSK